MTGTVLAPGKLMIAGEYAVLDGGPAIVLAIDRGVRCDITPAEMLLIETPDGDDRFVRPALAGAPYARYSFDHWNPTVLSGKPGFGGSAAACVAACVAAGRPAQDAFALHREIQGGGSGADVAAAIHGGMIRFETGQATPLDPVHPVVIWSGQSAQTQPMIDRYLAWAERSAFLASSRELVDHFSEDPVMAFRENAHLLMDMATRSGLPYMTPRLAAVTSAAHRHGGAAKPSGAGGGDCAIALFGDADATGAFVRTCTDNGWPVISVAPAVGAHHVSG
jgi:phosphomevalonate kinase